MSEHSSQRMLDFYDALMAPLEWMGLAKLRKSLLGTVHGHVLEIGAGTGENLKYYHPEKIQSLALLDPETDFLGHHKRSSNLVEPSVHPGSVESLPFESESFDHVVFTLVFCSVTDPAQGLSQIHRVLRPGGKIHFIEHVASSHKGIHGFQRLITPGWKRIAGGCHMDRDTLSLIQNSAFQNLKVQSRLTGSLIWGTATKAR